MTLDPKLLAAVDKAARRFGISRSAFAQEALRAALNKIAESKLEKRYRAGYAKHPVGKDEFAG